MHSPLTGRQNNSTNSHQPCFEKKRAKTDTSPGRNRQAASPDSLSGMGQPSQLAPEHPHEQMWPSDFRRNQLCHTEHQGKNQHFVVVRQISAN